MRQRSDNSEIVVALVWNEEVTLKLIVQKRGELVFQPANVGVEAVGYLPEEVQGALRGLLRSYR